MKKPQILLTNDDGIKSPGLWAAAGALSEVGFVHVVAPREQLSGMGRSFPRGMDGIITEHEMSVNGKNWKVYAVGGSPAQTVLHAVLEILPEKPDLVVSGINYGENLGVGVTASGTVGAALEAGTMEIRSLAVSLETDPEHHLSYSEDVDFTSAAYFTGLFADLALQHEFPGDVRVLKIDVPCDATPETPWQVTRLSHLPYFHPTKPERTSWDQPGYIGYKLGIDPHQDEHDTDVYAVRVRRYVSVTPVSLDLTARADFSSLENELREGVRAAP